jgi:hypothetical protein
MPFKPFLLQERKAMESNLKIILSLPTSLSKTKWKEFFVTEEYGSYFGSISGAIEQLHSQLGQVSILKRLIKRK